MKISEKSVRPNLLNEKYLLIKILSDRFFYFSLLDRAYFCLFMCQISGHLTEVLLKMIRSFYQKDCAANALSSLQDHLHALTFVCGRNFHVLKTNTHAAMHIRMSKNVSFYCFSFCKSRKLHASSCAVKVAPRAETSCRKVYRVTLKQNFRHAPCTWLPCYNRSIAVL